MCALDGPEKWTVPSSVILGICSKSYAGGGDGTDHSSVCPLQGLDPATAPFLRLRRRFRNRSIWAPPKMKAPNVASSFHGAQAVTSYVKILLGMSETKNIGK